MKILHVLDHSIPLHSGYTFRTRNILKHQRELGWQTAHVTGPKQGHSSQAVESVDGLDFYRTPELSNIMGKVPIVNQLAVVNALRLRLEEVIRLESPDIVHAHSPALNGVAALLALKGTDIPLVYECRAFWEDAAVDHGTSSEWGPRYRLTRAMESYVFRNADAVTTICEGLRADIAARGIDSQKITVIPNAVDPSQFEYDVPGSEQLRNDLSLTGKTVLGFVGSFYAYEGIPLLLAGVAQLLKSFPDVRLLLVGGGPQEAAIRQAVSDLGLDSIVTMTGRVPHSDVQDYYRLIDLLVYPRMPMRLTELVTPLKPLEAMAQGKIVVASDVGGHRELINSGDNGFLFRADDDESLVEVLAKVLNCADELVAIKTRGLEFVTAQRTWRASVDRYAAVYDGLVKN